MKTMMKTMPLLQKLVTIASLVMLLELIQKFTSLQKLIDIQDINAQLASQTWTPPVPVPVKPLSTQQHQRRKHISLKNETTPLSTSTSTSTSTSATVVKVPDVTFLSTRQIQLDDTPCQVPPSKGPEGRMGFQALTKVQVNSDQKTPESKKLLCIVITDSTEHSTTLPAIVDTYAPHCDGFFAASNQTDASLGAFNIQYSNNNEWERVLNVWKYVQHHYRNDFDIFHLGGDDMYVIPENLQKLVSQFQPAFDKVPLYLGGAVVPSRKTPDVRYCGGGAGYTLNSMALHIVATRMGECQTSNTLLLKPDYQMAMCLDQVANLKCAKTTDSTNALRYLEYGIDYQAKWSKQLKGTPIKVKPLADHHGIYMKASIGGISTDAVSFHMVNGTQPIWNATKADTLRRVHAILRGSCKSLWDTHPAALDGDGNAGYVHDPTYLRKHPLSFTYHPLGDAKNVCKIPLGKGAEGEMGHQGLQKIRVMPESSSSSSPKKKVLCLIYTHSGRHD
jgi:glycoprotein-N-acetylgalactosamine 3-beta-galactosyltransferase